VGEGRLLAEGGTLVVEHGRREVAPDTVAGLQRVDSRRFGDTVASLYRAATVP
jgi:16S rRNA G966 N2-methylase RsmD